MVQKLDIDQLLSELTLSEKISLLAGKDFWHTVPIERLNIPSVRVSDGPNGIRGTKFFESVPSNCFPCGTGVAATFNKDLFVEAGELMGKEAKMKGAHCILGPTCNIARGPLGGRAFESYSEDPLLSGHAASHIIKGIQNEKVLACIKHYVCNDQEEDRKCVDTFVSERALREIYLKPFQIAIKDSNPRSLMTAYNKVNGVHVSQSKKLLQDVLRKEWGFDGLVMSDWFGTYSMKESLDAGLNLEMPGPTRFRTDLGASHKVSSHEIHTDVIDENVRYVLQFINEGLEAGIPEDAPELPNESPEASKLLRKVGDESIVLLKNDNVLPISKSEKQKIAVLGPNVKAAQDSGGGSASLAARYKVTPWEGIVQKVKEGGDVISLEYSIGATLDKNMPDIGRTTKTEKGETGITANFFLDPPGTKDRRNIDTKTLNTSRIFLADYKNDQIKDGNLLFYADFESTFVPEKTGIYEFGCSVLGTAQVFVDGKLVVDNKTKQELGDAFFLGMGTREERGEIKLEKGVSYQVKVEFGTSPTFTLPSPHKEAGGVNYGLQFKIDPEEEIKNAVNIAKNSDKVIMVVGLSKEWESEGFDRPDMDIPGNTNRLIDAVTEVNKNVIVVNQSGSPVTMPWINKIQGLVHAWYGGNELGNTIADVLFGDFNPSGKLSLSFPEKVEHNPSYLTYGSTNGTVWYGDDAFVGYRHYELVDRKVLFPFGFGLSYTTFKFDNLKVNSDDENVTVTLDVSNTGKVDGGEAVQVYIQQQNPDIRRPKKELKDFAKVFLKAGETKTVKLVFSVKEATSYWDSYRNKWYSQKDQYNVLVGNSSDNILLTDKFSTTKSFAWLGL